MDKILDWNAFETKLTWLVSAIKSEYHPDIIVGITRGGVVPARLLCRDLGVKKMYCINVEKIGEKRVVSTNIEEELQGKDVLLVEDYLETGRSLVVGKVYLESLGANVKTAALYFQSRSEITPDFFNKRTDKLIRFPWE